MKRHAKIPLFGLVLMSLAGIGFLSALCMAVALSWSLDDGFESYLHLRDEAALEALVATAVTEAEVLDRQITLRDLETLKPPRPPRRGPPGQGREREKRPPESFEHRLVLLGPDGQPVGGPRLPRDPEAGMLQRDVVVGGKLLGTVAVLPRGTLPDQADAMFLRQQRRFGVAALGVTAVTSVLAASLLAARATRLGDGFRSATADIAARRYEARAPDSRVREIADVAADVNELAVTLRGLDTARRRWLAELSHELRTPLTALRGELEAITDGVRPNTPEAIASLQEEAVRLSALVDGLHEAAISDLEGSSTAFEPVDLAALMKEVCARWSDRAEAAGLSLAVEAERPASMRGQPRRLDQVVQNLVSNALRYTEAPGRVVMTVEQHDDFVTLIAEDTAPCPHQDEMRSLFEPLYRADAARSGEGSGLGLAVVATIVQDHGGTVRAERSFLGGLKVTVRFPRAA